MLVICLSCCSVLLLLVFGVFGGENVVLKDGSLIDGVSVWRVDDWSCVESIFRSIS